MIKRTAILLLPLTLYTCQTSQVCSYHYRFQWSEERELDTNGGYEFEQHVFFDRPHWHDEEYSFSLYFEVLDSIKFVHQRTLFYPKDSGIVSCHFEFWSPWTSWTIGKEHNVSGEIRLISWANRSIQIFEDIRVHHKSDILKFKGRRIFKEEEF